MANQLLVREKFIDDTGDMLMAETGKNCSRFYLSTIQQTPSGYDMAELSLDLQQQEKLKAMLEDNLSRNGR